MSTIVFLLLALECLLALRLFHLRIRDYPLTCIVQLAVAGLYTALMIDFYADGPLAYRGGVEFTRPLFRAATAIVAAESVMLMAQGIPNVRWFAADTSMVFVVLTGMAMLAGERLVPGTAGTKWSFLWSMGCVVYLVANHWLYTRGRPLNPLAGRHALGAMVMMASTAVALGLAAWSEGRGAWAVLGHVVGRVGPIAGLIWWMKGRA